MQGRKRAEEGGDMAKQANYLRHMAPRLKERYGAEKAQDILKKAQKRYEVLLAENKDDPPAYSGQKRERIYCRACGARHPNGIEDSGPIQTGSETVL